MSSLALILILIAAVAHATRNLAAKGVRGGTAFAFQTAVVTAVLWAPPNLFQWLRHPETSCDAAAISHPRFLWVLL